MEVSFVILETHSRVVWLIPKMEVTGMTGFVFRPYTAVLAADIRWRCSQPLRCIGVLLGWFWVAIGDDHVFWVQGWRMWY